MTGDDRTVVGGSDAPKPDGTGQPAAPARGSAARAIDSAPSGSTAATGSVEQAGDQVGPYKLLSLVGEGGFGTVWLAERREPFVQRVALKLIKPGMDSKAVLGRFEQERQALAVMNHPGIARVLDGGLTPAGRPFFAMEYVKGEPVTEFCDRLKLGIEERLKLFEQACEAIQHAHLKGIVHRDIKPGNILAFAVEGEGPRLKVIDFGVAKAMSHAMTAHTVFTETGQMIGTPEYMSPEQADPTGEDIDTRSDVYSLGVVLYELLSGLTPLDPRDLRAKGYREQQRIIDAIPGLLDAVRADGERDAAECTRDAESCHALGAEIRDTLHELSQSRLDREDSEELLALDIRQRTIDQLIDELVRFTAAVAAERRQEEAAGVAHGTGLLFGMTEGLHLVLMQLSQATRDRAPDDIAMLSMIAGDRGDLVEQLRAEIVTSSAAGGGTGLQFAMALFERSIWLVGKLAPPMPPEAAAPEGTATSESGSTPLESAAH